MLTKKKSKKSDDAAVNVAVEEKPVYAFPTKSRCPRCGSEQTKRYGQKEHTQYRECQAPVCRHRYSVHGEKA